MMKRRQSNGTKNSAEQDFAAAQYDLGACYLNGLGVEEDESGHLLGAESR